MKYNEKYEQIQKDGQIRKLLGLFTDSINKLLYSKSEAVSYQLAYDNVFKLTKLGKQTQILALLQQRISTFIAERFQSQKQLLLRIVKDSLIQIREIAQRMAEICLYLDLNYCQKTLNTSLIRKLNASIFKAFTKNQNILKTVAKGAFQIRNQSCDQFSEVLKLISQIDQKQQFFQKYLIPHYIPLVNEHYITKASEAWKDLSLVKYLEWCKERLQAEEKYVFEELGKKKKKEGVEAVVATIYSAIVSSYKQKIYQAEQKQLFQHLTYPILQLFKFGKGKEIEGHIQWFMQILQKQLNQISIEDNDKFINSFCQLYEKVGHLLKNTHNKFEINYRSIFTFQQWINNQKFNIPLRLNMLIDQKFRTNDKNFEEFRKKIITIFKLVKEKTLFQNIYRKTLINRLTYYYVTYQLQNQESLINSMEKQCGEQWTIKIKQICSLFAKDRTNLLKSKDKLENTDDNNWNIGGLIPVIITENAWPFQNRTSKVTLNPKLLDMTQGFEQKYFQQIKKQKLLWTSRAGAVKLSIKFGNKHQDFIVSVDMANLLLFIENKPTKLAHFVCENGYALDEAQKFVQDLIDEKLIVSTTKDNDLQLKIVDQFAGTALIDLVRRKIDRKVQVKAMEQLKADRKLMVEAIIVKIMKGQKVCRRVQLVQKVNPLVSQKGFKFNAEFVQKSIDRLIEKEFLRDFNDQTLGYIA